MATQLRYDQIKEVEKLLDALEKRGFYNPHDVFHHAPDFYSEPEGSKYDYGVEIVKWNTRSARVVKVGARWNEKKQAYTVSTYKQGSIGRIAHGENMR